MSNDVLITPASRKVEFKDSSANVDAKIETDASGNLVITNTGGDISIGDTTSDIFVGDGTNNIDIVFEQDGEIRGTTGVTVTLGQSDSNIRMATDLNLNNNDITNVGDLTVTGNLTITGDINSYNVTDLDVSDKTITLGVGQSEVNSGDSGIIISGSNASMLWNESNDRFDFNKAIRATVFTQSASSNSSFYGLNLTRSGSGLTTPDVCGSSGTLVLGTSTSDERLALSTDGALIYGRALVRQASSDQNTSQDSASIPSTTGAEIMRFEGGYTNGQYTTEFAKVDRSGNLPLYVRQSLGTANSFSNIARFGNHGQSNGSDMFAVFGGTRVGGNLTVIGEGVFTGNVEPSADSSYSLGTNTVRWANVYADTLYGDGSNITGITATDSTKLPLAGGTMTGNINLNGSNLTGINYLQFENEELTTMSAAYQMVVDANDTDSNVPNHGNTSGSAPFGIYFTGDGGNATTTLGSGLVKVWHTGHFTKDHIDYFVGLYNTGVTSTEFDKLDGLTATTTELNYTDGVTSNIQTQLNAKAPTASPTFTGEVTIPNKIIHSGDTDTYFQFQANDQARIVAGNNEVTEWRSDRMQMNNKSITWPDWSTFSDTALSNIAYNSLNAPIHLPAVNVGSADAYLPILQGSAQHTQGYRTSYVLGGFKQATTGSAWGDGQTGFFMAMGGNDAYPTKEFRFTHDGRIWFTDAGSSTYLDFDTSNTIKFIANGGQRMEITGGGVTLNDNLAVGGNQLENVGNAYFNEYLYHNGDTDTYIRIQDNSWTFRTGGGDRLVIDNTNLTVNANLNLHTESSTGTNSIHLPRGGQITFYGDNSAHHSIASTNNSNAVTDDLRISSYGAVYVDLDSNNNNTSAADFVISRHNATANLFKVDGETGAGKGMHSYPNAGADGVSLMSYAQGTVPINQGVVQIRSVGKTGWAPGDEMGSIDFYNNDGSGIGARTHARIVSVNSQGNGTSTTTYNSNIEFYTSEYNTALQTVPALTIGQDNSVSVGNGSDAASCLKLMPADDGTSDDLQFYNGTTRMGEIGTQDTTWLRINQVTSKNIYTPRYIRADNGFFVDGTAKGINGSGNFIGGTITGASDANVSNWDTAYSWGDHGTAGYLTGITSSQVTTALGYTPYQEDTALSATTGTFSGDITVNGGQITMTGTSTRDKYRLWTTSSYYNIGMQDSFTFGSTASDYCMTFQMNDDNNRGFWWGDNQHSQSQGAMVLTTDGRLTVAKSARLGFGESDTTVHDSNIALQVKGNMAFGEPGGGTDVDACWLSFEGNADTSGEGSGRLFFREHNSTTAAEDSYGMSLGYRGGGTTITSAGGNSWTGLAAISNGQWGMWGHDGDATGALIMYGDRAGTFVDFASNNIQGITDAYIADQIIHTGDTNTYMQFHAADQWRVVTGGTERFEVNNTRTAINSGYLQITGSTSHQVPTTTATAHTVRIGNIATHISGIVIDTTSTAITGTKRCYTIKNDRGDALLFGNQDDPDILQVHNEGHVKTGGDLDITQDLLMAGQEVMRNDGAELIIGDVDDDDQIIIVDLKCYSGNGRIYIDDGQIFFNGTSNSTAGFKMLQNTGAFHSNGDVIAYSSTLTASDERLKENIKPLEGSLDKILNLKGVNYDWKSEDKPNNQIGLIAQEVEKVVPEVVNIVEDGLGELEDMKVVNYSALVPVLIEAVKMQQKQIEELKKQVQDLGNQK